MRERTQKRKETSLAAKKGIQIMDEDEPQEEWGELVGKEFRDVFSIQKERGRYT